MQTGFWIEDGKMMEGLQRAQVKQKQHHSRHLCSVERKWNEKKEEITKSVRHPTTNHRRPLFRSKGLELYSLTLEADSP